MKEKIHSFIDHTNGSVNCTLQDIERLCHQAVMYHFRAVNVNLLWVKTAVELKTSDGIKISNMIDVDSSFQVEFRTQNVASYQIVLKDVRLYPDLYFLSFYAGDMSSTEPYDYAEDCISFEIIDGGLLTGRTLPRVAGLLFFTPEWSEIKKNVVE